jgi:hypothetical protein
LWCDIRYFLGSEIFLVRILWSLLVFFVLISVRGDLFFVDFPARVLRLPLIRTSPPTSSGSCSISKFPIFAFVSVFSCRILMPLLFVPTQFPAQHFMPVSSGVPASLSMPVFYVHAGSLLSQGASRS